MSKANKETSQEVSDKISAARNSLTTLQEIAYQKLTPFIITVIANGLELTALEDGWNRKEFSNALKTSDQERARKKVQNVWTFFTTLFETLSEGLIEEELSTNVVRILQTSFNEIVDVILKDPEKILLFSDSLPFNNEEVVLWRKASFLSHIAFKYSHYLENSRGKTNIVDWLIEMSEPNTEPGMEGGLLQVFQNFMRGEEDF